MGKRGRKPSTAKTKICTICQQEKNADEFYLKKTKYGTLNRMSKCKLCHYASNTRKKYPELAKNERHERKIRVFHHYGGKCACCGESELTFLAIDHINGGGNTHRKALKNGKRGTCGGDCFYRYLEANNYPPGYQALCHNCNHAKAWGVCPHKLSTAQGV